MEPNHTCASCRNSTGTRVDPEKESASEYDPKNVKDCLVRRGQASKYEEYVWASYKVWTENVL
jgi:hypothetical protein